MEIEALFEQTLVGDYEDDAACDAVHALRLQGSREVFEHAAAWLASENPVKRARAAAILGQLQNPDHTRAFCEESYSLITRMLANEEVPLVLDSAISALGHLYDPRAIPVIIRYEDHPDQSVRFSVAFALGCFPNDPESIRVLVKLTADSDSDVRDWAVFGLGVLGDSDSPEIREALLRRLEDEDEDVREEAAIGLGKRRDSRLLPVLLTMLDAPELKIRVAEAAAAYLGLETEPPDWSAEDYKAALL